MLACISEPNEEAVGWLPGLYLSFSALRLLFLLPLHALCCEIQPLLVAVLIQHQVLGCTASTPVKEGRSRPYTYQQAYFVSL